MVLEVVDCWAESLANQQRIARDSDQGLKSESREKSATPEGNRQPNQKEERERERNRENKQERKKRRKMIKSRNGKNTSYGLRGVGCNLGSAGNGFLCDVADGLIAFSEIGLDRRSFPTEAISDVLDGKAGCAKSDGGCDAIGVRDEAFDVDTKVVRGVGISSEASGLHDLLDIVSREEAEGTRVVAAEDADGIARGYA